MFAKPNPFPFKNVCLFILSVFLFSCSIMALQYCVVLPDKNFIYFWLHWVFVAGLGFSLLRWAGTALHCCTQASHRSGFSCCGAQPSVVATHGFTSCRSGFQSTGSVVVVHGFSCSVACGVFPDQGSNPCPLHWQVDTYPLHHQGSPRQSLFKSLFWF